MAEQGNNFPAPAQTPGQEESRTAYQAFQEDGSQFRWWADYLEIREQFPHFSNWRVWVYIAWAGSPLRTRKPATEAELAETVLGCSDRAIRNWKAKTFTDKAGKALPSVEEAVAWVQAAPLMRYRRDVIEALIATAKDPDPKCHQDRKLFLMMSGDFDPKQEVTGPDGGAITVKIIKGVSVEDL